MFPLTYIFSTLGVSSFSTKHNDFSFYYIMGTIMIKRILFFSILVVLLAHLGLA